MPTGDQEYRSDFRVAIYSLGHDVEARAALWCNRDVDERGNLFAADALPINDGLVSADNPAGFPLFDLSSNGFLVQAGHCRYLVRRRSCVLFQYLQNLPHRL